MARALLSRPIPTMRGTIGIHFDYAFAEVDSDCVNRLNA